MVKDTDESMDSPIDVGCGFYTPKEVATILNLSLDMVYDLLRDGKMPAIRLGSGRRPTWRIPKDGFEIYLKSLRTGPGYDEARRSELKAKLKQLMGRHQEDRS